MQAGTDAALIDASRGGDRTAFARIIERHHRAVYAMAFAGVRDRARADDVTQDTFVLAWRRLDDLRDADRLGAWLCGIARNLARDARRQLQRETLGDVAEPIDATTPFEVLTEAESERLVAAALAQVPDVYREPLVLFYYQDRSVEDVARTLGITPATTNKRLSRGRQYLADRVATLVERGLTRRGPSPALVGSVLAAIALVGPASHVDASPLKGSTMSKLAIIAAISTATVGGAILFGTAMHGSNAHAKSDSKTAASEAPCLSDFGKTLAAKPAAKSTTAAAPSLFHAFGSPSLPAGVAEASSTPNDCGTVGRHLAELEADATHGPAHRPDEATCEKCAGHYSTICESETWSAERRACTLAAPDLLNAHLCAGAQAPAPAPATVLAPELECAALGASMGTKIHAGGLYTDVTDMPQQIEAACQIANWSVPLRQCFAAASGIPALKACVDPSTAPQD